MQITLWYLNWAKITSPACPLLDLNKIHLVFHQGLTEPRYCRREISWQCSFQGWAQPLGGLTHIPAITSVRARTGKATGMPLHPLAPCQAGQQHCFASADLWATQPGLPLFYISEHFQSEEKPWFRKQTTKQKTHNNKTSKQTQIKKRGG